jgi:uncharacterized protein YaiE (UPF0345 family)
MQFKNVTATAAGNVHFDGKVVSHAIVMPDGEKKTLGVIMPGAYHFDTGAAEVMEMVQGACTYILDGTEEAIAVLKGSWFEIPANSGFTITVNDVPCHYVCSYIL